MHLARFDTEKRFGSILIPAGEYVVEDAHAGEFLFHEACRVQAPDNLGTPFVPTRDWNGRSLLIVRSGGFGDLLCLTPLFRELKRRWPALRLHAACFEHFHGILQGNPDLDRIVPYPVPTRDWKTYDAHLWLENAVEKHPLARTLHIVDLFAHIAAVPLASGETVYWVAPDEAEKALAARPRTGRRRAGIQVAASVPSRSYPPALLNQVVGELLRRGWEVLLFGKPGQSSCPPPHPHLADLTDCHPRLSFRESAALLATCDVCLAPDSVFCHLAGSLGLPAVGLFGPFPAGLRVARAASIRTLTGHCPISPCFHHQRGVAFPEVGPCRQSGQCDALASLAPLAVADLVEEAARNASPILIPEPDRPAFDIPARSG